MTWTTTVAAIFGLICMQFIPLPKWKFLFSLSALSLIIIGIELIAIRHVSSSPNGIMLFGGVAIGLGIGYFLKCLRLSLSDRNCASLLADPSHENNLEPAATIAEKLTQLGGHPADPASTEEIEITENRLGISLPPELKDFLLQHNGTKEMSNIGMWSFWPCSEIINYSQYSDRKDFTAFKNDTNQTIQLSGDRLILFADAMIHTPIYGVYLAPGETYHGSVFELISGTISAHTFKDWIGLFLSKGEDGVL